MEWLILVVLVVLGCLPLYLTLRRLTDGRPIERSERRAWLVAQISGFGALLWFVVKILGLFTSAGSGGGPASAAALIAAGMQAFAIAMAFIAAPALVAIALTVVAARKHQAKLRAVGGAEGRVSR
jgi:hypothetical protein